MQDLSSFSPKFGPLAVLRYPAEKAPNFARRAAKATALNSCLRSNFSQLLKFIFKGQSVQAHIYMTSHFPGLAQSLQ